MSSSPPGPTDAALPLFEESVGVVTESQAQAGYGGEGELAGEESAPRANSPSESPAQAEVRFLLAEADSSDDKSWATRVYFEAAYLQESALGQQRAAARTYAKALTTDPTFQPTAWSLRRQLGRQGYWENLVRVIEAEARFASNTRSQDRADLLVERGLLLTKHLANPAEGSASFKEAVRIDPKHRAGWLALLQHSLWQNIPDDTQRAFEGLLAVVGTPHEAAAWTVAYSEWLLLQGAHAGATNLVARSTRAIDVLLKALANGVADATVLRALDRYSVSANDEPLRMSVLDAWDFHQPLSRSGEFDAARLMALREKARRLIAHGALAEAAGVLDRAMLLDPRHPVVEADRLDLAVLSGRMDVFDTSQSRAVAQSTQDEHLFRRADLAMRQGAWGEAMGALGRLSDDPEVADVSFVERVRTLAALQDPHGVALAYETHADQLLGRIAPNEDERKLLHEVAHQYVRAGAVWESELADSERAETLYSQALALVPSYRPAQEGLASVFTRDGRWENLVELVASDAAMAASSDRAAALRESLVLLNRDLLHDFPAALAAQNALADNDVRGLFRRLDLAALLSEQDGGALDDALAALALLQGRTQTKHGKSALWILSACLAMGTARDTQVDGYLDQALAADPLSLAAAFVERRSRTDASRMRSALAKELSEAVRVAQPKSNAVDLDRLRALRFRQAFVSLEEGQFAEALSSLDPLVRQNDIAAWGWQVDVLRRVRDPLLLRKHLANREAVSDVWSQPRAQITRAELFILLGECCEQSSRRSDAFSAFDEAAKIAERTGDRELIVRSLLGCLRTSAVQTNIAETVSALQRIARLCSRGSTCPFGNRRRH
jgi:tetratricopeptide (TPR) repeat protein